VVSMSQESSYLQVEECQTLLNPVIALTITDFEMFESSDRVISRYRLKEKDDLTDYSDDIELVFVELPKFHEKVRDRFGSLVASAQGGKTNKRL
jgi:predicted transposase/invertase (TIGR01784 family)